MSRRDVYRLLGIGVLCWVMMKPSGAATNRVERGSAPAETPVTAYVEPTRTNTGPRTTNWTDMTPAEALAAHGQVVSGRRITGSLDFKRPYSGAYDPRGKTYTFVDCEIQGNVAINTGENSSSGQGHITPDDDMLTLNMSYCRVGGGLYAAAGFKGVVDHCSFGRKSQWSVNDRYDPSSAAPGRTLAVFQNCYFWAPYQAAPSHYEVVQSFSKIAGLKVVNCTFEQQGGSRAGGGVTAIVNLALEEDNLFDNCYFLWDGDVPAFYAIYAAGNGTFKDCRIEGGAAYVYPGSQCTFTNCRDYATGKLLSLP